MCSGNIEGIYSPLKPCRESIHEKHLLLSSVKPHNLVVSCTISGCLNPLTTTGHWPPNEFKTVL